MVMNKYYTNKSLKYQNNIMKKVILSFLIFILHFLVYSQDNHGEIHGNLESILQSYNKDLSIEAEAADEIILNNANLNINYIKGNFQAGLRYESY